MKPERDVDRAVAFILVLAIAGVIAAHCQGVPRAPSAEQRVLDHQ